ncbi:hypothetical protein CWS43_12080 [Rahnella sp. AA]|uniref:glycerate kinase n=1 Tax=Rahnella sp. AA TaxID=2057180 RepID=UPI000C31E253|nr:hypothetical protein CWS43_12080 [Rahnella sp. AA]
MHHLRRGNRLPNQIRPPPIGVAKVAKFYGAPVIALAGNIGTGTEELHEFGIDKIFSIVPGADNIENLLKNGPKNVERTCENIARLIRAISYS